LNSSNLKLLHDNLSTCDWWLMLYLDKVTEGEVRRDAATDAGIYRPMIHEKADMAVVSAAYPGTP